MMDWGKELKMEDRFVDFEEDEEFVKKVREFIQIYLYATQDKKTLIEMVEEEYDSMVKDIHDAIDEANMDLEALDIFNSMVHRVENKIKDANERGENRISIILGKNNTPEIVLDVMENHVIPFFENRDCICNVKENNGLIFFNFCWEVF